MKKTIPTFKSDEEAAAFVDAADLSQFDLKGQLVRLELKAKDKTISLRLPDQLLQEVKSRAAEAGMPAQRFMRLALEKAVKRA